MSRFAGLAANGHFCLQLLRVPRHTLCRSGSTPVGPDQHTFHPRAHHLRCHPMILVANRPFPSCRALPAIPRRHSTPGLAFFHTCRYARHTARDFGKRDWRDTLPFASRLARFQLHTRAPGTLLPACHCAPAYYPPPAFGFWPARHHIHYPPIVAFTTPMVKFA